MQTVNGFTLDSGNIYKATLDWDLGHRMFVMNNNTPLDLARWPNNIDGDRFTINSRRSQGGSAHPDNRAKWRNVVVLWRPTRIGMDQLEISNHGKFSRKSRL